MSQTLDEMLPPGTFFAEVDGSQISAMRFSVKLGRELQHSLPQIADDYRNGKSLKVIAQEYGVAQSNNVAQSTAIEAVRYAISGYAGTINFLDEDPFPGLLNQDEYTTLARQHHSQNALRIDAKMKDERRGIYGIPMSTKIQGAQKGAQTQIEHHIGIHGQTAAERRTYGRLGAQACGHTVWTDKEKLMAIGLASQPGDAYQKGSRLAIGKIAKELNETHHNGNPIRTPRAVGKLLSDYERGFRQ